MNIFKNRNTTRTDVDGVVWVQKRDRHGKAIGREIKYHDPHVGPLNPVKFSVWRYPDEWRSVNDKTGKVEITEVPTSVLAQLALLDFFFAMLVLAVVVIGMVAA